MYELQAVSPFHYCEVTHRVEVSELGIYDNLDFEILYLTPATNLICEVTSEQHTVDLGWDYDIDEDYFDEHPMFNVYRQKDSDSFKLIGSTKNKYFSDLITNNESVFRYYVTAQYSRGESERTNVVSTLGTVLEVDGPEYTRSMILKQNYPNPFNPDTKIVFSVPEQQEINLYIFNIKGELVKTLIANKMFNAGEHTIVWNGTNDSGYSVASGLYIFRLKVDQKTSLRKGMLLR
jgi:hypothetical protein